MSPSEEDMAFLDEYMVRRSEVSSRSSVIHNALASPRTTGLEDAYTAAWEEWASGGGAELWERGVG